MKMIIELKNLGDLKECLDIINTIKEKTYIKIEGEFFVNVKEILNSPYHL